MKYYIYRSPTKIDMLWEQLDDKNVEKYTAELKMNFGLISGGIKSEPTEKNLHARLELVLEHLKREKNMGTIDQPSVFIEGTIPMTWQEINFIRGKCDQRMVLFSGYDPKSKILVGLVGSASYVTGMNDLEPATLSYAQPSFWNSVIEQLGTPNQKELKENLYDLDIEIDYQARRREDGPVKHNLEFAAKTFIAADGFVVGSPLFVAES